jgi:hypothetical protein
LAKATTADEVKQICLQYAEEKGLITRTADGIHARLTGAVDPEARTFSKIVTLPSGRRMILEGARSQAELDAAEEKLKTSNL